MTKFLTLGILTAARNGMVHDAFRESGSGSSATQKHSVGQTHVDDGAALTGGGLDENVTGELGNIEAPQA